MNFKHQACKKTRRSHSVKIKRIKWNSGKRTTHPIVSYLGNRRNINNTRCHVGDLC